MKKQTLPLLLALPLLSTPASAAFPIKTETDAAIAWAISRFCRTFDPTEANRENWHKSVTQLSALLKHRAPDEYDEYTALGKRELKAFNRKYNYYGAEVCGLFATGQYDWADPEITTLEAR